MPTDKPHAHVDLAQVAEAGNELEAMFLIDALAEAEIPATQRGSGTLGAIDGHGALSTRIFVPRDLLENARAVVERARAEAHDRRIDNAFESEAIADAEQDAEKDPKFHEMLELREVSPEERDEELRSKLVGWIGNGMDASEIARYLAAAGLARDEAEKLLNEVNEEHAEEITEERGLMRFWAVLLVIGGIGIMVLAATMQASSPDMRRFWLRTQTGAMVLTMVGVAMFALSKRSPPTLERKTESKGESS